MNLFLAVILHAFANDKIKEKPEGLTKLDSIRQRIAELCCCCCSNKCKAICVGRNIEEKEESSNEEDEDGSGSESESDLSNDSEKESGVESQEENIHPDGMNQKMDDTAQGENIKHKKRKKRKERGTDSDLDSARGSSPEFADAGDKGNRPSKLKSTYYFIQ